MTRALASLLLIGLAAVACQGPGNASRPDIIIASDTATSAYDSAVTLEDAIDFAIRQQPSIEGYRLAYWRLDNSLGAQQSPLRGRENVRRMISEPRVLGVISPNSSFVARVEMPEANLAHLAMLSSTTTSSCLTVAARVCKPTAAQLRPTTVNNYFRISPPDPLQGKAMALYAATLLGRRHAAAFNEFGPEGSLYIKEFSEEFARHGGSVVYQQELDDTTINFSAFLSQAKAHGADAVYAVADRDHNACKAAAQMSAVMPGAIFLGTDGFSRNDSCIADLGTTPPEVWATHPAVDAQESSDPAVKKLVAAYVAAYPNALNKTELTPYIFAVYDCARILIDAITRAIKANGGRLPSRAEVVAAVAQTKDFAGVTGTYSFDENGDALSPMMSIYKVHDGRWEFVQVHKFAAP